MKKITAMSVVGLGSGLLYTIGAYFDFEVATRIATSFILGTTGLHYTFMLWPASRDYDAERIEQLRSRNQELVTQKLKIEDELVDLQIHNQDLKRSMKTSNESIESLNAELEEKWPWSASVDGNEGAMVEQIRKLDADNQMLTAMNRKLTEKLNQKQSPWKLGSRKKKPSP